MRKIFFSLLMASALMPAAGNAAPGGWGVRSHDERSESKDEKAQDRPQRAERPARVETDSRPGTGEPSRVRNFGNRQAEQVQQAEQAQQVERVGRGERDKDSFGGAITRIGRHQATQQQGTVQVHRDGDRDGFDGLHERIVRNGDRVDGKHRWSRDWRKNSHYNWYNYRSRYGSLYRLGRYNDPYGYGYRRFSIGYNLWPSYYGSSYWLNDPWQYRLPPAYGPYRWVRYYEDALLVNIYDGQVVDVIRNFFW